MNITKLQKVLIFILLLASGFLVLWMLRKDDSSFSKASEAMPKDAFAIIEANNIFTFSKTIKENKVLQSFFQISPEFSKSYNRIDSIIFADLIENKDIVDNSTFFISFSITGKTNVDLLLSFEIPPDISQDLIYEKVLQKLNKNCSQKEYENTSIYSCGKEKYYSAIHKGLILISTSEILIEKSIRQLNTSSVVDELFLQARSYSIKNSKFNVYLNFDNISELTQTNLNNKKNLNFTNFTNWLQLDATCKDDEIVLTGISVSKDSLYEKYSSILVNQDPRKFSLENILPSTTKSFFSFLISDYLLFNNNLSAFLNKNKKTTNRESKIERINNDYRVSLVNDFNEFFDGQAAMFKTSFNNLGEDEQTFGVVKIKSESIAKQKLERFTNILNPNTDIYKIDNDKNFNLYKIVESDYLELLFGDIFGGIKLDNLTFVDDYLVFGSSKKALGNVLHYFVLNKSLNTNFKYKDLLALNSGSGNCIMYLDIANNEKELIDYLDGKLSKNVKDNFGILKNIEGIYLEISSEGNILYNSITSKYSSEKAEVAKTKWESLLDTSINMKPQLVLNHYTNEKEIFVQDLKNNIYLINKMGRILWKINIGEKILSDIYQVDLYKNNKLQYLFNTSNQIFIIDREGNYVEKYPVKLRSKSSGPLSLFDYENNKNYRIFIPTIDKDILCYDIDGKIISGWNFKKTSTPVTEALKTFRIGTKDYIVFADEYNIYIVNRRGDPRIEAKSTINKAKKSQIFLTNYENQHAFITTNNKGELVFVNFQGDVITKKLKNYPDNHYFLCEDIDGNDKKDYIFAYEDKVDVYRHNFDLLFSERTKGTISSYPIYFIFSSTDKKIGLVSEENSEIYLLNNDGKEYRGFPLKGSTPFSISYFDENSRYFNLIVGSDKNFLYNYTLH